jgi:WhiB family redox-sensing transcriptional regulator
VSQKEYRRRVAARWQDSFKGVWRKRAACDPYTGVAPAGVKIPDFSSESLYEQRSAALFCHTMCPVQAECLAFAMDTGEEYWVWGGTTETEREHLMKKARQERQESA